MKKINILLTLSLIFTGVVISTANATLTGTWSDATTQESQNYQWGSTNNFDWTWYDDINNCTVNSHDYTRETGGSVWTEITAPSIATRTSHDWDYWNWDYFNRPCDSASHSSTRDWHDDYNVNASTNIFPIISNIGEGAYGGPSDLTLSFVGTHITTYVEVNDGVTSTNGYNRSTNGYAVSSTLLGSRGTDSCSTNSSSTIEPDPEAEIQHSGGSGYSLVRNTSCSVSYQASYTGPTNTYAIVTWSLWPRAVYECNSITGGDITDDHHINPGASEGPGSQISFPLESFHVSFHAVGP